MIYLCREKRGVEKCPDRVRQMCSWIIPHCEKQTPAPPDASLDRLIESAIEDGVDIKEAD